MLEGGPARLGRRRAGQIGRRQGLNTSRVGGWRKSGQRRKGTVELLIMPGKIRHKSAADGGGASGGRGGMTNPRMARPHFAEGGTPRAMEGRVETGKNLGGRAQPKGPTPSTRHLSQKKKGGSSMHSDTERRLTTLSLLGRANKNSEGSPQSSA